MYASRHAGHNYPTQPTLAEEVRRYPKLVFRPRDGVIAVDVTSGTPAARLRSIASSLGDRHDRRICCPRLHRVRSSLLSLHCHRRGSFRELPVPDPSGKLPPSHPSRRQPYSDSSPPQCSERLSFHSSHTSFCPIHLPSYSRHTPTYSTHLPSSSPHLRSGFSFASKKSFSYGVFRKMYRDYKKLRSPRNTIAPGIVPRTTPKTAPRIFRISLTILSLPIWPIVDSCRALMWLLVRFTNWVHQVRLEPPTEQTTEQQIAGYGLDLHCILWTLQTSVDGSVRQSALEYLATMTLDNFNPIHFVTSWFDILLKCVQVTNGSVVIIQGSELVAEKSSLFCLHMLSRVVVADPTPLKVLEDVRQQFTTAFPSKTNFGDLSVSYPLGIIHSVFCSSRTEGLGDIFLTESSMRPLAPRVVRWRVQWDNYQLSGGDHAIVTPALVKLAQFGYEGSGERAKVPRWLLRFALHSLSRDPLPPPAVISDSLLIIAIDLECNVPDAIAAKPLDRR